MLHDVDFFQSRLAKIDGFGDTGAHLRAIINSKEVTAPSAASKAGSGGGEDKKDSSESDKPKGEPNEAETK